MSKELFVRAEEVAGVLGISKPYAYKLVREMNEELKQIQPRIDQTHKMMPEPEDFAALESQLADIDKEVLTSMVQQSYLLATTPQKKIMSVNEYIESIPNAARAKFDELRELVRWSEGMVWTSPERHGAMTGMPDASLVLWLR